MAHPDQAKDSGREVVVVKSEPKDDGLGKMMTDKLKNGRSAWVTPLADRDRVDDK